MEISAFRQGLLALGAASAITLGLLATLSPLAASGAAQVLVTAATATLFVLTAGVLGLLRSARPMRVDRARLLSGEVWARWSYPQVPSGLRTPGTVQERSSRTFLLGVFAVLLSGPVTLFSVDELTPGPTTAQVLALALAGLLALAQHRGTRHGPCHHDGVGHDVLLGPRGVYRIPGGYDPILYPQVRRRVSLDEDGQRLVLRFSLAADRTGASRPADVAAIPVPPGRELEARRLLERYHRESLRNDY